MGNGRLKPYIHHKLDDYNVPVAVPYDEFQAWHETVPEQEKTGIGKSIKYDELENGVRVSTVFLSINHSFEPDKVVCFETMVFPPDSMSELAVRRYETFEQAIEGHNELVEEYKSKKVEQEYE